MSWRRTVGAMCLALALGGGAVRAQDENPPRLHLVILADTQDETIGQACRVDLFNLRSLFEGHVPRRQLNVVALSGDDATAGNTMREIQSLDIRRGRDTVVFYYSGHGAYDRPSRDHVLQPNGQTLYRAPLRNAILRLRPKLAVLLADTCSTFLPFPPAPAGGPEGPAEVSPAFQALFFDLAGLVDITSARPGQRSKCDSNGGFFTFALFTHLQANAQRRLGWASLLDDVNAAVVQLHPQAEQQAYALSQLPTGDGADGASVGVPDDDSPSAGSGGAPRRVRFGVTATATPRSREMNGVEVTKVLPGYPGENLRCDEDNLKHYLIPGVHIITEVNGAAVTTYGEFVEAVQRSSTVMTVRVYNLEAGTHRTYRVRLRD